MYHFSTTALALATRPVPHYLQDCNADAPNPPQLLSVISHRPGRVKHGGLTTTSVQVVTNQSCHRETNEDPLQQMCLLSADLIHGTVFLQPGASIKFAVGIAVTSCHSIRTIRSVRTLHSLIQSLSSLCRVLAGWVVVNQGCGQ